MANRVILAGVGSAMLLAWAGHASADSVCTMANRNTIYCRDQPDPAAAAREAMEAAERARDSVGSGGYTEPGRQPGVLGFIQDVQQLSRNKKVGKLIASGDCPGALKVALGAGDLALAREVAAICEAVTPRAPPVASSVRAPIPPADPEWEYLTRDGRGAYFLNLKSFEVRPDGRMQMWIKAELAAATPGRLFPINSERGTWQLDCRGARIRRVDLLEFEAPGLQGSVTRTETPDASWQVPPEKSVAGDLAAELCANEARLRQAAAN